MYCLSKTEAESVAFEYAKRTGLDVITVCPTLVVGPILQSTVNSSTLVLVKLLKGTLSELYLSSNGRPSKARDSFSLLPFSFVNGISSYLSMQKDMRRWKTSFG